MTQGNIYFDFNATTPVDPMVKEQVPHWLEMWGNPSSIHLHGRGPKKLLRESRRSVAQTLKCHPLEIVFTSGGSEANNLALKGTLLEVKKRWPNKSVVLIGAIEHPSILNQIPQIIDLGFEVKKIPVNTSGQYDMEVYQSLLTEQVALVSVMLANNELGTLAPVKEMASLAKSKGALFHSDLVRALGKYPFDLTDLGVDLASFSSHKIYALKGAGILFVKKGTPLSPLTVGGAQERYRRAGTENLMAIASMALMMEKMSVAKFVEDTSVLRNKLEVTLSEKIQGLRILGNQVPRLANTTSFTILGVSGESLLMNLDIRGFSVGTGAACSSGNPEPSPVLLSIGLTRDQAQSSLRVSLGKDTTEQEVDALANNLIEVVEHLRKLQSDSGGDYVKNL